MEVRIKVWPWVHKVAGEGGAKWDPPPPTPTHPLPRVALPVMFHTMPPPAELAKDTNVRGGGRVVAV